MPSKSKAQQRLMQAAEHGADFPMAEKIRASMTHQQMHDFAVGSEKGKPEHVKAHLRKDIKGEREAIQNYGERIRETKTPALKQALQHIKGEEQQHKRTLQKAVKDPNHESYAYDWRTAGHPHKNLGKYLHSKKG